MTDNELLEYCRNQVDGNTALINELITKINIALEKLGAESYGNVLSDAYYSEGQTITLYGTSQYVASRAILYLYSGADLVETSYIYTTTTKIIISGNNIKTIVTKDGNNLKVANLGDYRLRAVLYG